MKKTSSQKDFSQDQSLYYTAVHEAAHAIICLALGKKFNYVSIHAKDDFLGRIRFWVTKESLYNQVQGFDDSNLSQEKIDNNVKRAILISYAGYVAELKLNYDDEKGFESDRTFIINIALANYNNRASEKLEQYFEETQKLVEENWASIEIVAKSLIVKRRLLGKEVQQVLNINRRSYV